MKVFLLAVTPLLIIVEVFFMMMITKMLSRGSDALFLLGLFLISCIIYLNYLLFKFIIKQFKN